MSEQPMFRIADVRKSFGPIPVLKGVDIDLRAGAVTVLMGANGAGKSTLVRILSGVNKRDTGTMTLDGRRLQSGVPGRGDPRRRCYRSSEHQ